jgi:histidine triad (HIT) family protein
LVVPRRHAAGLLDVPQQDLEEVAVVAQRVAQAAVDHLGAEGVNLLQSTGGAAFQTVFHLHVHVVPRYAGDGLTLPWVPTPGEPAVMDEAATRLRSALG